MTPGRHLPKYMRAAAIVRARVDDGTLLPGQSAPSAARLARETGYSTPTCIRALRMLLTDGVLVPGPAPNGHPRVPPAPGEHDTASAARALSAALASRRRAAGLTQPELAAAADVSLTAIGHAETRRHWHSRDFWERADKELSADGELLALHDAYREATTRAASAAAPEAPGPRPDDASPPSSGPCPPPASLLTDDEREAVRRAGLLCTLIAGRIVADGPTGDDDLAELRAAIQRKVPYRTAQRPLATRTGRMSMGENAIPGPAIHEFERTYLGKLRLAAQVILEAAPDLSLVSDPLEVELGIFKDRVEFMLLLPEATAGELPWRGGDNGARSNGDRR
jgi:hypothetical protein